MVRYDQESLMRAALRHLWEWFLTERQIIVRSKGQIRYVPLSRILQAGLGSLVFVGGGWFVYSTISYFDLRDTVFIQETVIARSEQAYRTLVHEMSNSRDRVASLVSLLGETHGRVEGLANRSAQLKAGLSGTSGRTARRSTEKNALQKTLSKLEGETEAVESRNEHMEKSIDSAEKPEGGTVEKSMDTSSVERLDIRVVRLARRLATVRRSQNKLLNRIAEQTLQNIDRAESIISLTGLDANSLLRHIGSTGLGQGGPFIPISANDLRNETFQSGLKVLNGHMDRWQDLQKLLQQLPLAHPMNDSWVSGRFGRRRDPFNRHLAYHRGIDLAGPWHAPVHAVAPGRVRLAGRNGRLGKMVEIDHGLGIRTRYGHMRLVTVKRGQSVDYRQKIGEQGNTGRSKSAHLHYEIIVNGRHVNPIHFLKAGEHVFKG